MSNDMREDILARLFIIMGTMDDIETNARNRTLLETEKRPAQVLLDGDENVRSSIGTQRKQGNASLMAPQIMTLRPELYYLPKEKRHINATNIGTEANTWRRAFLGKLWSDVELATLLGSNGSIEYNGCETDLKSGSAMSGEIKLDFIVNYVLKPTA
jgi:hypothetical protein